MRELKKCCLVLQLDSNEFCTTLKLPGRVYEAVETPDNPKAIIHHSKIDYIEKVEDILGKEEFSFIENSHIGSILKLRRVLTQGEDLWFTFSDQPMRFSLREFHLTTGLRCEEDQTITEPLFKIMKKPYIWMLGKIDKFTVRTLYEMFKKKARSMPTLERLSLGTAILTEAVIMAENPSSKIPRDRLQRYMNYRSHKIAWVNVLGKSLGKPCETSSSSDPLCLHWDSTRTPTIAEVLELEKINNVEVSTVIGLAEEYKHLVGATHSDDADFHSVVKLVQQGYKMRRSDWEKGFVDMFVATEDIGQQRKTKDEDAEHGEDLNHNEDEEEKKDEEEKTDEEENKDEEYQKDKEQRKDKNHSMSNSEKLDKLIQMVRDLDKRVVMIQNVLGVKFNDSSPNKEDCENGASSGDRRNTIAEAANSEDTIAEEANSGDGRSALDDENEKEICDEEAKSGTEHQREEENILGEIETTQKITQDEDTEKLESESCLKQTSQVTSPTPTFNTPNFDTRVSSPNPTFTSPKFDLLSQESHSGKGTNEVLMRDVYEIPVFQPLMKIKKRLVQQHSQVNEDVEPPLQKKFKADTDNVPLRRSERVDKTRKEKMREWKMSNKRKKLRINQEIVNAKWFSDIETPGKKLSKTHIEAGFELLKLRQINNPDLFLNKTALVVGVKFLEEIDEFYDEFLDDKKVAEKYWLGVVINLEKRNITAFNCAAMKFTDASLVPYVNAYAMALPFMIRYFFKDVSMDTSKFSIKIVSEGFPQVLKIEDSGVYALKLIECHAMRIVDLTKLSEEKIAIIREKLAVDIFSELQ
ncbi:BnaA09g44480D [Brassica napus]|uniref:BnaA09g44480D protein n=1 Tax=Brassica napus TaxID=3708 RepID=A0A078G9J6_BRANA|nr:BnaA09g44480D [Brassica napus]